MVQPTIHVRLIAGVKSVLADAAHPDISYRTGATDTWHDLPGPATFHPDRPEELSFTENDQAEMLPNTGFLKVSEDGLALTVGWHVKAMGRQWAIMGVSRHNGKRLYRCKRMVPAPGEQAGPDHGGGR